MNEAQPYFEVGTKDIVLLHGLFGSLTNWNEVIDYFQNDFQVYAPKLPLYQISLGRKKLDFLVDFLEDYLNKNQIKKPVIIGNSLGGHLALLYTLRHPDKVEKLILCGSSGLYESTMGVSFFRVKDYDFVQSKVEEIFDQKSVVTKELVDDVYSTIQNKLKAFSIINIARDAQKQNLKNELHKIEVPVQLIWGKQDVVTPPYVGEEFCEGLKNAELHLIDNCGHVPMMEQPKLFNQYVSKFINS